MRALVKRQDGYSLTEVLVAVAIFSLAVLALTSVLTQGYRAMGSAGRRSINLHQAQEDMDAAIDGDQIAFDDGVEVTEQPATIQVFGQPVQGTFITVRRVYSGQASGEVVYSYFAPVEGD